MRKALNENPQVQLGVLAVFAVIFAFILYTSVLSSDSAEPAPEPVAADSAGSTASGAAPATPPAQATPAPAPAPAPAAPATPAPEPSTGGAGADGLTPTKGLPEGVLVALAKGDAVALVVYDPKGISDRELASYVNRLEGRKDVAVFDVKAKDIARYSRITQGVDVNQTPALVVVSPRDGSGELLASVSYGFRSPKSVDTALEDALYDGGTRSASP